MHGHASVSFFLHYHVRNMNLPCTCTHTQTHTHAHTCIDPMCLSSLRVHHSLFLMCIHPSLLFIPFCLIEPFLLCLLSGYFYVLSTWFFFRQQKVESGSSQFAGGLKAAAVCMNSLCSIGTCSDTSSCSFWPFLFPSSFFSPCCSLPFYTLNVICL